MNPFTAKMSLAVLLAAAPIGAALAQTYPSKPIRLIVPSGPGSRPDLRARWIAEKLRPALGQPLVVENRVGAGGIIGTQVAAISAPDGYTLLMVHQGTIARSRYARRPDERGRER